ncbi:hypothetical protein BN948_01794 [Hydrogenophaga intermedia]|uniref:Uncharacterized protein n=1 Tax=Hydrogenophaga intermedia TaxID=65786 RepID=A0A1L1PBG7_HYDIT|nr:hypothetical protein [Hydrogenophaga intermedia]CDN87372.1 hypothetical protein BN948_01794 [Hydrogenophaga intermedia]
MSEVVTYAEQVSNLAKAIQEKADAIRNMEKARHDWTRPEGISLYIGQHMHVVRKDGVNPRLAGVQREALSYIDSRLLTLRGELEGLRFRLVGLGRQA